MESEARPGVPSGTLSDRLSTHLRSFTAPWWTRLCYSRIAWASPTSALRISWPTTLRTIIRDHGECWGTGTWGPWGLWGLQAPGPDTSLPAVDGHSSSEDASACMHLVIWKIRGRRQDQAVTAACPSSPLPQPTVLYPRPLPKQVQ